MRKITKKKKSWKWIAIVVSTIIVILALLSYGITHKTVKSKAEKSSNSKMEEIQNLESVRYVDLSNNNEIEEEIVFYAEEQEIVEETEQLEPENQNERTESTYQGQYYIKVNCSANTVTIYQKDGSGNYQPIKAMICSTGSATPQSGRYLIGQKYTWLLLFGNVYGHYCTRILTEKGKTTHILFHSVPYLRNQDNGSLEYWEFDKLGTSASMGCIRLQIKDTNWIYANIPKGTIVEFYNDSNPGPLGKPTAPKISDQVSYRDWDPTDPDPGNPWRNKPKEKPIEVQEPDISHENATGTTNTTEQVENNVENYMVENTEVENIVVVNNTVNEMTNTFIENTNSLVNETVEKNIVENTNQTIVNNTENVRENQEENQSI